MTSSALISKNVAKQVSAKSMVVSPANASAIRRDGLLVTCHLPQSVKTAVEQRKKPASSTIKARKRPEQDGQAAQLVKQPMHLSTIASHVLDLTASDEMMPEARDIVFRKQHEQHIVKSTSHVAPNHQPTKLHVRARESLDDVIPLSAMTASNNDRKRTKASDLDCNTVIGKVLAKHAVGNLKDLNVPEMQCFLRARKQPVGGRKAELEERITSLLKV
ncbi:hypothetical protein CEUSTIGMA_g12146.t1 [Chlamydomonas eustigma]|uniref:SAP domain-containing protein n=1 Tax=Chlamydomonas eustigma TaxID=1157962 RepID=A0A250XNQ9_9CHLO|nr:hypothetical protein CEUSTIGMA_g12146.t1 [Chlamydomonas eustigma]|eukprot:GAX84724.1 hypothetical protein CEUSTIGMA_g12146.t1 [Chlamydomonas eustigma]